MVTNVLGGSREGVDVEIHREFIRHGDALLLCTDGLNAVLDDREIEDRIGRAPDAQRACEDLIDATLQAGAPDNVTVVLARFREVRSAEPDGSVRHG